MSIHAPASVPASLASSTGASVIPVSASSGCASGPASVTFAPLLDPERAPLLEPELPPLLEPELLLLLEPELAPPLDPELLPLPPELSVASMPSPTVLPPHAVAQIQPPAQATAATTPNTFAAISDSRICLTFTISSSYRYPCVPARPFRRLCGPQA
jgi:hypothetical protein